MSSTNICSDIYNDPAFALVDDAWSLFKGYSEEGLNRALEQIDRLTSFTVSFHDWDGSFDATGTLSGFHRPDAPTLPTITAVDFSGEVPAAPTVNIPVLATEAPPAEPDNLLSPPDLNFSYTNPGPLTATDPGSAPELEIEDKPVAPTLSFPDAPTLDAITVPDAPSIDVTLFAETIPDFEGDIPNANIDFTETVYSSSLLTQLGTQLATMLNGIGIPAPLANAMWSRAISRDDQSSAKALQEATEEFGSKGWDEPNGILAARTAEVRQSNRDARSNINRDIFIQEETVAIENLRFAVSSGLQYESMLLQAHLAIQQRKFELAFKTKDLAIAIFSAQVARYNALIAGFNGRVEAYKAFLEGLRAQVDVYRAQVEAAKARGDINLQRVQAYTAQIQAQVARSDVYRTQIEGFKASIDAERARMDGYRATVDAFKARVEAYGIQWEAVQKQIDAEIGKGKLYETVVDGFASRVNIWAKKQDTRIEVHKENLLSSDALLRQHESAVRAFLAKLEAFSTYTRTQGLQSEQLTRLYEASAQVETAASDADTRAFQAETERARTATELRRQDAELQITQLVQLAGLLLEAIKGAAAASAQVGSAAFSAVSMSAGISSSQSRSKACSTNFSYSGEVSDAGA